MLTIHEFAQLHFPWRCREWSLMIGDKMDPLEDRYINLGQCHFCSETMVRGSKMNDKNITYYSDNNWIYQKRKSKQEAEQRYQKKEPGHSTYCRDYQDQLCERYNIYTAGERRRDNFMEKEIEQRATELAKTMTK